MIEFIKRLMLRRVTVNTIEKKVRQLIEILNDVLDKGQEIISSKVESIESNIEIEKKEIVELNKIKKLLENIEQLKL